MPKALLHFDANEIDYMLESGEIPPKLTALLEESLVLAKAADDGVASVSFFIDCLEEDEEDK